ncbi:hypothetical protein TVAG_394800 [Trichomonas vaginalis G3]|uniref:Uncharacterized protein n=1 Tax=Trichomonas vaginalis (strain ATCC PRA-98 / G3) TaxID=412133 RepID=A2EDE4_TRIV3|nr:armadillo (ARM) repeat-containing protein family [Trichomonas vaginalis G3]EAY09308.1 hypothetical protein TVAG_394800 [Trichomonas vaginalis G3]KAI5510875.1 armadillo (ARM) repeat-containing protein family [Trichomonas vaginalis G3]|eukprot:XP_001321531.1 hypothetical protein [Trichomonas vaginalis G3]
MELNHNQLENDRAESPPSPTGVSIPGISTNNDPNSQDQQFPDISNFLSQPKMSVKRLLKHTITVKLISSRHPQIVEYIANNVNELISIILSNHERLAVHAYNVLEHLQNDLLTSILQNSNLHAQILDAVHNKSSSSRILSYSCRLTALILTMCPGEFPPICDYVQEFYKYIENDPIIDFFQEITMEDISYLPIQEWLSSLGFAELIINELNTIEIDIKKDIYDDIPLQKLRNMFKLIEFSSTAPVLIDKFRCPDIVKTIMRYTSLPREVEDARWSALNVLYCIESADIMNSLFDYVFTCIAEPYRQLHSYRVSALLILKKMLQYDKTLIPRFKKPQIYQILLRTILQFRENSFALLAVEEFLCAVFQNKQLNSMYAQAVIPPLMFEGTKRENISLNAFSFRVIENALSFASRDREFKMSLLKIEEFDSFLVNELKQRRQLMKDGYGGKLPVVWA